MPGGWSGAHHRTRLFLAHLLIDTAKWLPRVFLQGCGISIATGLVASAKGVSPATFGSFVSPHCSSWRHRYWIPFHILVSNQNIMFSLIILCRIPWMRRPQLCDLPCTLVPFGSWKDLCIASMKANPHQPPPPPGQFTLPCGVLVVPELVVIYSRVEFRLSTPLPYPPPSLDHYCPKTRA